ncbi:MarR family winged helix-turn-helix transcriptional regulator [Liquorilactobacillus mali]|uniref:MarR family winged helix-turn-helix transcriptional regulator n=1 Tax=Liquorilactobacillus mali TaxID=1618 RepID=UPI002350BB7B|nr:MarR family transcriptional regulator [Liquorilactobacillus mali]MDC7952836.1 MarR family transcriptional regulator [Liquorilactobacillus mali]
MKELYLDNCLYFASNRLARQTEKLARQAYRPTGLSPTYNYILLTIDQLKQVTLHDLAVKMGIAPSTMSRLIQNLVAKDLIVKKTNWRQIELTLSKKGKENLPLVKKCYFKLDKMVSSLLTEEKKQELILLLDKQADKFI